MGDRHFKSASIQSSSDAGGSGLRSSRELSTVECPIGPLTWNEGSGGKVGLLGGEGSGRARSGRAVHCKSWCRICDCSDKAAIFLTKARCLALAALDSNGQIDSWGGGMNGMPVGDGMAMGGVSAVLSIKLNYGSVSKYLHAL